MDGVVLEQVRQAVGRDQVVDADEFDVRVLGGGTHHEPTDASESVDTNFERHRFISWGCRISGDIAQQTARLWIGQRRGFICFGQATGVLRLRFT